MSTHREPANTASASVDQAIGHFSRDLFFIVFIKHALKYSTLWCFAWGTIALVLRATTSISGKPLLWGAAGLALAMLLAARKARRERPARREVEAILDARNQFGGLLMTRADATIGAWESRLSSPARPRLRWKNNQAVALICCAALFVAISLLIPVRWAGRNAARALNVGAQAESLAAQIEALRESRMIEEAKAEELDQKLDQLVKEASAEEPAKTWEALDHLAEDLEKTTKDAVEKAQAEQARAQQAEALSEALQAGGGQLDEKTMTEAMQTLSSMMQNAMKENEALARELSKETQEALKSGALKPEHLSEISKAMSKNQSARAQNLSKLAKSGAINPNALKNGAKGNRPNGSDLAKFLKENSQQMSVADMVGQYCENPGRGGVSRGRADAEMTWTDGADEKNAKFKEELLPPSAVVGLDESELVGLSTAAPTADKTAIAAHGSLNKSATGGGSAYTQSLLPRHKGAVKRYFERSR
jgi:hypothetical protein